MPTNSPTSFETYIYDHKQYSASDVDTRPHRGPLHDPSILPVPKSTEDTGPSIMVEPSYETNSNAVFLIFRGNSYKLTRHEASQLRDALIKVCQKPTILNPCAEIPVELDKLGRVKVLHQMSKLSLIKCEDALEETEYDMCKAISLLRKKYPLIGITDDTRTE